MAKFKHASLRLLEGDWIEIDEMADEIYTSRAGVIRLILKYLNEIADEAGTTKIGLMLGHTGATIKDSTLSRHGGSVESDRWCHIQHCPDTAEVSNQTDGVTFNTVPTLSRHHEKRNDSVKSDSIPASSSYNPPRLKHKEEKSREIDRSGNGKGQASLLGHEGYDVRIQAGLLEWPEVEPYNEFTEEERVDVMKAAMDIYPSANLVQVVHRLPESWSRLSPSKKGGAKRSKRGIVGWAKWSARWLAKFQLRDVHDLEAHKEASEEIAKERVKQEQARTEKIRHDVRWSKAHADRAEGMADGEERHPLLK